jgi:E3 ubiquitin-protein ligase synoviolin
LALLPVKKLDATLAVGPELDACVCAICLEDVEQFHNLPCEHVFHTACLKEWLYSGKSECPVCRRKLITPVTPFASSNNNNNGGGGGGGGGGVGVDNNNNAAQDGAGAVAPVLPGDAIVLV